jgi:hypothetical protein
MGMPKERSVAGSSWLMAKPGVPFWTRRGFISKWYFHGPSPHYLVVRGSAENFQPLDGVTLYLIIEHQWGSFAEHIISQEITTCILLTLKTGENGIFSSGK